MYAHLTGVVAEKTADSIVMDVGGVGYLVSVTAAALQAAPRAGEKMKLYTSLSVREDALVLYGFVSREEKMMFERLCGVSGIGPKSAVQILSAIGTRELSIALVAGDAAAIARAPGVGKKTAQRLILELRDKIDNTELTGLPAAGLTPSGGAAGEAIEALMALGYQPAEAARAVSAVSPMPDRVDEIVRLALRGMAK